MATAIPTNDIETPRAPETPPAESSSVQPSAAGEKPLSNGAGGNVIQKAIRKWKREDFLDKIRIAARAATCVFSLIAAIVMGSNKHGDWKDFDHYDEYRYIVAITLLGFLYTLMQLVRFVTGRDFFTMRTGMMVDFVGDQAVAYFMISAVSAAIPLTNRMREGTDNLFTDASAASISMAFFAFVAIATSAIISGYKLSKQTYII